jgi:hypothetical protein
MSSLRPLGALGLLTGPGRARSLVEACHLGLLKGGLSVSLRALPDELVGPLASGVGGPAMRLKVLEVRTGPPMVLEIAWRDVQEKWEVVDLETLVHDINDLFAQEPDAAATAVLGEWEDMLQLWCIPKRLLSRLLKSPFLDDARNRSTLVRISESGIEG